MKVFRFLFSSKATSSFWRLLTVLVTLVGMLLLSWVMFNPIRVMAKAPGPIPVAMHSAYAADYGVDSEAYIVPAISLDLIDEAIRDAQPSGDSLSASDLAQPFESLSAPKTVAKVLQNTASSVPTQITTKIKPSKTLPASSATPQPSLQPASTLIVILSTATPSEIVLPAATRTPANILPDRPTKAAPVVLRPTKIPKLIKTAKPIKKPDPTNWVKIKKTKRARP